MNEQKPEPLTDEKIIEQADALCSDMDLGEFWGFEREALLKFAHALAPERPTSSESICDELRPSSDKAREAKQIAHMAYRQGWGVGSTRIDQLIASIDAMDGSGEAASAPQGGAALTDEEIDQLCAEVSDYDDPAYFRVMARAVERKVRALAGAAPEPSKPLGHPGRN